MPFAVFTAMVGGNVPLEGDKGGEAVLGGPSPFETGFQNHSIAFPLAVWLFQQTLFNLLQYFLPVAY